MRMIGIGLMGFLIAGVALLLSTMNIWDKAQWAFQSQVISPRLAFETPNALPSSDEYTAIIVRSDPNHPIILSGLPAYQGIAFNLPLNARPTSGYLQIDATAQVLNSVEGVLRVSIDNVRRGEVLLHPGVVSLSLQVPLSPSELARQQLVVSLSLQGSGRHAQCRSETGVVAIAEIETTSAVHLTLDRPLTTTSDRVNAWGGVVRVGWPNWLDRREQARRLVLATQAKQQGITAHFLDDHAADALSTAELREVIPSLIAAVPVTRAASWPRHVALKGANAGLRQFQTSTQWRANVDLREGAVPLIPAELDLHLALGRQSLEDQWTIVVTLNGRLLRQDLLTPTTTRFDALVSLPAEMISANNVIEVTASSSRTTQNDCSQPPALIAEMLPNTALIAGESVFSDALSILQTQLSDLGTLRIGPATLLNAVDADAASDLLVLVMPADVRMRPAIENLDIMVVTPSDVPTTLPEAAQIWHVTKDTETGNLSVTPLVSRTEITHRAVGLLIFIGKAEVAL
ncbi:hypothetical protein OCA8868_01756 [Octadecabacter ascidiaceicola]|uniref:Cyclic di-GMP-binding protein n=2 Tax=Octadecabacter ascidiaceicola TaxID=1655543 RepID=A0A238K5R1_9RHOB|nr:hypothetical protein OCA8868_01756 [Octadecabacter ascidiaceicola]